MPQRSIHDSLGYWSSLLSRSMEAALNKRLAAYGVTRVSWAVLGAICFDEKRAPSEISAFLRLDRAAVTRLLDKLVDSGLVERGRDERDRRAVSIKATPKGRALAVELSRESEAVNADFAGLLTDEEAATFIRLARKMTRAGPTSLDTL